MIQLIKGSIFDSKCDLIIIPCNNLGGMTLSTKKEIISHDFPYFNTRIELGNVIFIENRTNFSNASVIGYAASVNALEKSSSEKIIQKIAYRIKNYCEEYSLHKVNIPLIGTGAGGLSPKTSYNILKKEFENLSNILLCIYAFSEDIYFELSHEKNLTSTTHNNPIKNPRVFISYTGTNMNNRTWVKNFAYKLRESGVDARLDMFHLKPGQDLPQWMTNELLMADKVLLICDKYYAEKADNRNGGVGWETMIIQGDMLSRQEQNKYAVILRDKDIDQSIPVYARSKYALNWTNEEQIEQQFNDLLLYLFDCDIAFITEKLTK